MKRYKTQFGQYGGQYVPETLFPALLELSDAYKEISKTTRFKKELNHLLKEYVGRPTPLFLANRLSDELGLEVFLKREDLNHTGSHKINNTVGQILLAKAMGKTRIIAETGAGQHGVATATACALMGMPCCIYMGEKDVDRQALNVFRIKFLGATIRPVSTGSKTLKDAATEAMRDWMSSVKDTHYIVGSVIGPHPFPSMVRDFHAVIGREAKKQFKKQRQKLPDAVIACVGGGSNAIGIFSPFIKDKSVRLIAVEAAGKGLGLGQHAAALEKGRPGILHGAMSYLIQTKEGQVEPVHSISAGLDYPGIGPELSFLKDTQRLSHVAVTDQEAVAACRWVSEQEGVIPALETAHAFAALKYKKTAIKPGSSIIVNVSGRGDKDMGTLMNV